MNRTAVFLLAILHPVTLGAALAQQPANNQSPAGWHPVVNINQSRGKWNNSIPGFTQGPQPPAGFPVPVYTSNQQQAYFFATTTSKMPSMSGTIITNDPPSSPYGWYKQYLGGNGWTLKNLPQSASEKSGQLYLLTATKGDINVSIAAIKQKHGNGTLINISSIKMPSAPGK